MKDREHHRKNPAPKTFLTTEDSALNHEGAEGEESIWMSSANEGGDEPNETDDVEDSHVWFEEATEAFLEDPCDETVFANFPEAKKQFYTDARKALDKSCVSRGFYPAGQKGKGRGKDKGSSKGKFTGRCMRCGKVGHKAMDCKQVIAGSSSRLRTCGLCFHC